MINFQPTSTLGIFIFFLFFLLLIFFFLFLDILTFQNTNTAKRNVFKELNTSFVKKANILPKHFLTNITSENIEQAEFVEEEVLGKILLKAFKFNLTLLPHQIIIFPIQYTKNITSDVSDYKILDNNQLRYKSFFSKFLNK